VTNENRETKNLGLRRRRHGPWDILTNSFGREVKGECWMGHFPCCVSSELGGADEGVDVV